MKVIYVSSACYPPNKEKIDETANNKLEFSGIKFHNLIIQGLEKNGLDIVSLIGLPISIKSNKKIVWKKEKNTKNNIQYIQLPFINIPIIKQIFIGISCIKEIKKIIKENKNIKIIVDAAYVSILPFLNKICKKYDIEFYLIFADIYNYMSDVDNNNIKIGGIEKYIRNYIQQVYKNGSGYIFLTQQMNQLINKDNKPYVIMEGLVESENKLQYNKSNKKNAIMYAGKLSEKFGIKNMIEAFRKLEEKNIELWIYGFGEMEEYITKNSLEDERIKFLGLVSNEIILKRERQAKLLVNPRPTSEEYTKFSFPSKNMEYMLSGTPILTTKLPGMPKEYYKYVYIIEDETINGMKKILEEILSKSNEELEQKGLKAREFVIKEKNNYVQANKIQKLIGG